MKSILAGLTDSTTLTYGDTSKTYLAGRFRPNTLGGKQIVAPALTNFADVQTAYGMTPGHCNVNPTTGRKFELANVTTNTPTVLAFNFDIVTGQWTFIGRITLTLPNGTHTFRGFDFDDSDPNNIKLMVASTVTTTLCLGGVFYAWNLALSDFTVAGTTIPVATGPNQKAVYFAQYAGQVGLAHTGTTAGGVGSGRVLNVTANKTRFYMQNGSAALPQIYAWDTSLGNPTVDGLVTNGVTAQTTAYASTSPAAFYTMAAQNGYTTAANSAAAFEAVIAQAGTAAPPSNVTASPFGTAQTYAFMRDLQRQFTLTVTALTGTINGTAAVPATYTNNGVTWNIAVNYTAGATTIVLSSPPAWNGTAPTASGTLTLVTNTGTQTNITFSSVTPGAWFFNLAATSTGAAVTPATASSSFTMARGAGITSSHSFLRTGTLTPAMTGTIVQTNSFGCVVPTSVPAASILNNQDCLFLTTNSSLYLVRISDITDGGTTWSSRSEVNLLGGVADPQITSPSALLARYSSYLDQWVYVTNTSKFVMKPHQNNKITKVFGALSNQTFEANSLQSAPLGMAAIVTINISAGWLFITGSTTGQRGVIAADLWSDDMFGNSYAISKVMYVPPGSKLRFFTTDEASANFTGDTTYYIRSATTASDPIFSSPTGGWIAYSGYTDQSPASVGPYFQLKVGTTIINDNTNSSPAQLHDILVAYDEPGEIDYRFVWQHERTTLSGANPMAVSVRQVATFSAEPTKFLLLGYDDAGNLVSTIDSSVTPAVFALSSNNGTSYTTFTNMAAFMTSFNSASGNTEIKITISSPPAVANVTWSFTYA